MRKNVMFSLVLTVCVIVLAFTCVKTEKVNINSADVNNSAVLTVSKNANKEDTVLETRFLNMLNHNFVYDDAFYYDDVLVENALLGLLDVAEESYVDETYLSDYIFNMYGRIYNGFDFLDNSLTQNEGYVYIAPRGYCVYSHKIISLTDNNDGSFTVITDVAIEDIDGSVETFECETVFLKADDSAFGYNIMYSEITEGLIGDTDC